MISLTAYLRITHIKEGRIFINLQSRLVNMLTIFQFQAQRLKNNKESSQQRKKKKIQKIHKNAITHAVLTVSAILSAVKCFKVDSEVMSAISSSA